MVAFGEQRRLSWHRLQTELIPDKHISTYDRHKMQNTGLNAGCFVAAATDATKLIDSSAACETRYAQPSRSRPCCSLRTGIRGYIRLHIVAGSDVLEKTGKLRR